MNVEQVWLEDIEWSPVRNRPCRCGNAAVAHWSVRNIDLCENCLGKYGRRYENGTVLDEVASDSPYALAAEHSFSVPELQTVLNSTSDELTRIHADIAIAMLERLRLRHPLRKSA